MDKMANYVGLSVSVYPENRYLILSVFIPHTHTHPYPTYINNSWLLICDILYIIVFQFDFLLVRFSIWK